MYNKKCEGQIYTMGLQIPQLTKTKQNKNTYIHINEET